MDINDIQAAVTSDLQDTLADAVPGEKVTVRGVQIHDETVNCVVIIREGRYQIGFELPLDIVDNPVAVAEGFAAAVAVSGLAGVVLVTVPESEPEPTSPPTGKTVTKAGGAVELPKDDDPEVPDTELDQDDDLDPQMRAVIEQNKAEDALVEANLLATDPSADEIAELAEESAQAAEPLDDDALLADWSAKNAAIEEAPVKDADKSNVAPKKTATGAAKPKRHVK